ncbi:MAG TPA: ATP-binding protein [Bacteroidales bacterium]|nr:ATP-binding protein [Bacteroidales bacterium]HOU97544.1 ATP-binding protein [Bacteroidales bacterium]
MKNKIQFPSKIENISIIERLVDELTQQYQINSEIYGNMLVSMVEAVNNAIIHGNKLDENKSVEVEYEIENGIFTFSIKDEGNGFDYKKLPDPTTPENIEKPHGRGIFLISHLVDELSFEDNGSKLCVKIKINPS